MLCARVSVVVTSLTAWSVSITTGGGTV